MTMQMPFGKYAGVDLEDIPLDYLRWIVGNVPIRNPHLRQAIEDLVDGPDELRRSGLAAEILGGGVYILCGPPDYANYYASRKTSGGSYDFVPVEAAALPFPVSEPPRKRSWVIQCREPCGDYDMVASVFTQKASKGRDGEGSFEKAPAGNHPAVLVAIVDMGTQRNEYQGKVTWQRRAFFVWELVHEKQSGSNANHVIAIDLTVSLNEKAKLRKWVEARIGRQIRDGEDYDITQELGQPCLLGVIMKGEYPKVDSVAAVPKGMSVPGPQNKPVVVTLDEFIGGKEVPAFVPWLYGEPLADHIRRCKEIAGGSTGNGDKLGSDVGNPGQASRPANGATNGTGGNGATAGPPPRKRPTPEKSFWFALSDAAELQLLSVSAIKQIVETTAGIDITKAEVCPDGTQDWTPITLAIPEAKSWVPF